MFIVDIMAEVDIRVPNAFTDSDKIAWLNEVNNEFFDVVKIPKAATFNTTNGGSTYVLGNDVRAKNIDRVVIGTSKYLNFLYEEVNPGTNYFTFDDATHTLTLSAATTQVLAGIVRYHTMPTSTYVTADATSGVLYPDAPSEYHWIYVLGICARAAKAMNDAVLGNNYDNDYKANLMIAQQNYAKKAG